MVSTILINERVVWLVLFRCIIPLPVQLKSWHGSAPSYIRPRLQRQQWDAVRRSRQGSFALNIRGVPFFFFASHPAGHVR
jgi:hypothetical protein